jgi:hypothetical protein
MTTHAVDRLSEYLDGDIVGAERSAIEAHLAGCAQCATTLEELRRVATRAASLPGRPLPADLWPDIAARIGSAVVPLHRARRWWNGPLTIGVPQLAAAAVILMAVSGGAVWLLRPRSTVSVSAVAPSATIPILSASAQRPAVSDYDAAVSELQRILDEGRGRLDSNTVRRLEKSLKSIDDAIDQARRAVDADPQSLYLHGHLAETRMRKLELLRRAAALASAQS